MTAESKRAIFSRMLKIRRVEEAIAGNYGQQKMRCPVHLSIGQEAVPACLSVFLTNDDKVYSTHRCHAHYLGKGGSVPRMIAELYGKVTGCAKGKGGSMHLVDAEVGMMGSSALVGGSISLAVGSAMALKRAGSQHLAIAYFGDGGSEEGVLYECLNFSALKKLPILFICENNLYATYSHQKARQNDLNIAKRGEAFGVASEQVDGYDLQKVCEASERAVLRARGGDGPSLLEFSTYRWRDHVGPAFDHEVGYRTQEEVQTWMARCPLESLQAELLKTGQLSLETLAWEEAALKREIEEAFQFAECSALPNEAEIFDDIYTQN